MTAPHTGSVMAVAFIHWVTAHLWTRETASLFTGTDEATGPPVCAISTPLQGGIGRVT